MGLSPDEVHLHEVLEWAEEQTKFLRSLPARLVLWYLCHHAWRHDHNNQGGLPGDVLSKHTSVAAIQRGTGLGNSTVRETLEYLQDEGYVLSNLKPGFGKSEITVFWSENADLMREDYRAGIKPLPKGFKKESKQPEDDLQPVSDAVILQFPTRHGLADR